MLDRRRSKTYELRRRVKTAARRERKKRVPRELPPPLGALNPSDTLHRPFTD